MAGEVYVKSGKTFRYQSILGNLVGRGAYGRVFAGHFKPDLDTPWKKDSVEVKQAAIKRVEINFKRGNWVNIHNDREFVALKELRHPCIVRLFAVEDDDNFRNYVFELCQATLEDFITKKYGGLMPDEVEGLNQMASGLKFIHKKKMIHRDIKPENVLVHLTDEGQRAWLKISDLGFTKPLKKDGIHYDLASGLKGTEYYMAPELLGLRDLTGRVLDKECTIASDVFAAGCTFFRYLNRGLHPFGKGFNIEVNIMEGKAVNATKYDGDPWKTKLIAKMVKFNPKERPSFSKIVKVLEHHLETPIRWSSFPSVSEESLIVDPNENYDQTGTRNVGDVRIDRRKLIGKGTYGMVFAGTFKGEKVAVKRVELMDSHDREIMILQLLNHPNIVQFKHYEKDRDFGYIVLEICAASLSDFIYGKYKEPMPSDEQVLFQLANGLKHIHSRKIFHRNIEPGNVLISLTKPVQMKWSGFGLSKSVNENGSCSLSEVKGTRIWKSPEELRMLERMLDESEEMVDYIRGSVKSEIFSAGCIFIFFLLRGKHPFEDPSNNTSIRNNIIRGDPINVQALPKKHFARHFVLQMIENDPEKRISLREVIDQLAAPLQPPILLSLLQYDSKNLLFSTGTFSLVYHVGKFGGSLLAVKRVPREECTKKSFEELKKLDHPNVIRFLHFDEDYDHIYFGMELCVASLDKLFLSEDDPKKYKGPVPSDEQFGFQLISGLQYIHGKNLVHGSIKPTNILISSSEDPQIKLSDFGLTTSCLTEGHTTKRVISGFLSSRYWLAPELLECDSSDEQCTKESDIFAAGSVFFYFLSKGCHLFGDATHEIIKNTSGGIHANIFCKLSKVVFPSGLIRWMTSKAPGDRPKLEAVTRHLNLIKPLFNNPKEIREIGDIQYSVGHFLEGGGQGKVFIGKWKDSEVAVKRIADIDTLTADKKKIVDRERKLFEKLVHRNIVKLLSFQENYEFLILALEKCLTSLHDYCCVPQLYHGIVPMPSDQEVLLQMTQGLNYIHSQGLIHRDVKPKNILISYGNPAVIKWADFGMSRTVITGSQTFSWSKLQGTDRWLAPELITASQEKKIKGSQKCDIFALGCVFFFFLVPGIHPFGGGDDHSTKNNIKDNNRVNFYKLPRGHFAFDIIKGMIENDRKKRSKLHDVIQRLSTIVDSSAVKVCSCIIL